ncbi:MAG: hypothetical protein AcusKO_41460 [Acuticoccus sp.]
MFQFAVPNDHEIRFLDTFRDSICVSLYMPTGMTLRGSEDDRARFRTLSTEALRQMYEAGLDRDDTAFFALTFKNIYDALGKWPETPHGIAVFAALGGVWIFGLPYAPEARTEVSDRFHIKPLVLDGAAPGHCYVLWLQRGEVSLHEVTPRGHRLVDVPGMPADMLGGNGAEPGNRMLTSQICRRIDLSLREALVGREALLILAGSGAITSIYRAHNTWAHLSRTAIYSGPDGIDLKTLCAEARAIATRADEAELERELARLDELVDTGLASRDLDAIVAAAARGEVRKLLMDPRFHKPGRVEAGSGQVTAKGRPCARSYDIYDELVGLTVRGGGDVHPMMSGPSEVDGVAAIFRRGTLH